MTSKLRILWMDRTSTIQLHLSSARRRSRKTLSHRFSSSMSMVVTVSIDILRFPCLWRKDLSLWSLRRVRIRAIFSLDREVLKVDRSSVIKTHWLISATRSRSASQKSKRQALATTRFKWKLVKLRVIGAWETKVVVHKRRPIKMVPHL